MSPNISNYLKYCINSSRSVDAFLIVPVSSEILLTASAISDTFAVTSSLLAAFSSLIALSSVILFIIVCFNSSRFFVFSAIIPAVVTLASIIWLRASEPGFLTCRILHPELCSPVLRQKPFPESLRHRNIPAYNRHNILLPESLLHQFHNRYRL